MYEVAVVAASALMEKAMTEANWMLPKARIPYGTWGSSYFPAWQTSALAEVNIGQFAGESMNRIMGLRGVPKSEIEYLVIGSTIPWHWKFWNAPLVASCMGHRVPGYHVEQACATGLQAVTARRRERGAGRPRRRRRVHVRPHERLAGGGLPRAAGHERTQAISDVWDNFGFDPATGKAMIAAAGKTARKYKCDRAEVDDVAHHRYEQYFEAKGARASSTGCSCRWTCSTSRAARWGASTTTIGVRRMTLGGPQRGMRELDTCVTAGGRRPTPPTAWRRCS